MSDFKSDNNEKAVNKTRAGRRPVVNIDTSEFLPKTFRTPLNRKWLDATLNRMVSKGDLEDIHGFVGKYTGEVLDKYDDVYINTGYENQLSAAIVSEFNDVVVDHISGNDILNNINYNFENYSLNGAYNSQAYVFAPPINIDKFLNYSQYFWAPILPIIEIIDNSAPEILDPTVVYAGRPFASFTTTNGPITLHNGMIVKFVGSRWPVDIINNVYLVTGVGKNIRFKILTTTISVTDISETYDLELEVYTSVVPHTDKISGEFSVNNKKDYIVINNSDEISSAWSRANYWVHRETLSYILELNSSFDIKSVLKTENQAKRPIIEFNPFIVMMDNAYVSSVTRDEPKLTHYKGKVNYLLGVNHLPDSGSLGGGNAQYTTVIGDTVEINGEYVKVDSLVAYQLDSYSGEFGIFLIKRSGQVELYENLSPNNTFTVINDYASGGTYNQRDLYVDQDYRFQISQVKLAPNTAPMFKLADKNNVWLDDFDSSTFTGSKIFSYKSSNSSIIDSELGFPLAYKDAGLKSEILYENNIINERHTYQEASSNVEKEIKGYYFFKIGNNFYSSYFPSAFSLGAKEHVQVIADSGSDVVIPYGTDNWSVNKEYLVFNLNGKISTSEILTEGSYNRSRTNQTNITLGGGKTYTFHNLLPDEELKFWDVDTGNDIETIPGYEVTVVRDGPYIYLQVPESFISLNILYGTVDINNRGIITVVPNTEDFYHHLYVNGVHLDVSAYSISSNSIVIPSAQLVDGKNIIDLEYYSNSNTNTGNTELPEIHNHNSNNLPLREFTISDTHEHWESLIRFTPGFTGQTYGENNYHLSLQNNAYGGEIFMHEDISIMHDYAFSSNELNISTAIENQAADWYSFKKRFINQVKRIAIKNNIESVSKLVDDVCNNIIKVSDNNNLHADSNMYFPHKSHYREYVYVPGDTYRSANVHFNIDEHKQDHIYIYVVHNRDSDNIPVEEMLQYNIDYEINGSVINISSELVLNPFTNGEDIKIKIYYHDMDEKSYIPASMTKLGLSYLYRPRLMGNKIICHDGEEIEVPGGTEIFKVSAEEFNPLLAALYDLETKIYTGIKKTSYRATYSPLKYFSSQHRGQWYSRNDVDGYIKRYFDLWFNKSNYTDLNDAIHVYRDENDAWTWNYSSIALDEQGHLNSSLPGNWRGAYVTLFGTSTPHLTPWHMLGFRNQPSWWGEFYSWTDPIKRDRLIKSLKYGIVSRPDEQIVQDLYYARYYWDFDTKCPVDTNRDLVSPDLILGDPGDSKLDEFVFGDWSPIEFIWRSSVLGQAAHLDAVIKLLPAKAWTDFFKVGQYIRMPNSDMIIDKESGLFISNLDMRYHDDSDGKMVGTVIINRSDSGFPSGTEILFVGGTPDTSATATLDIDTDGKIVAVNLTGRGYGYDSNPAYQFLFPEGYVPSGGMSPTAELEFNMVTSSNWTMGINHLQQNSIKREKLSNPIQLGNIYRGLDTRLLQDIAGFTRSDLIKVETESGAAGKHVLSNSDFNIVMNESSPKDLYIASEIYITKTDSGYNISGISPTKQQFKFFEPAPISSNDFVPVTVNNSFVVKKYKTFSSSVSIIEFNSKLARIQDVYNFIRGYYSYLESVGYVFVDSYEAKAIDFATWASTTDINEKYTVAIGTSVSFVATGGVAAEYGSMPGGVNSILAYNENGELVEINYSDLCITRTDNSIQIHPRGYPVDLSEPSESIVTYTYQSSTSTQYSDIQDIRSVSSKNADKIACVATAVIEYDHAIIFKNTTQFNEIIYDDVVNHRQQRLKISGQRTRDWAGVKSAPGYLIKNNTIIQNYDTAVSDISDIYNLNVTKFNKDYEAAELLTVGNTLKDWINNLNLASNTSSKLYQGLIRRKGSNGVLGIMNISDLIHGGRGRINVNEEWMFKHSSYGDTVRENATEIELNTGMFVNDPVVINFEDPSIVFINRQSDQEFRVRSQDEVKLSLPVAGNLQKGDADYTAFKVEELPNLYNSDSVYANIPTWSPRKSYRLGDTVRYKGNLWEASENISYIDQLSPLVFTGTEVVTNTQFTHRNEIDDPNTPSAEIDGVKIWFDKTGITWPAITVEGDPNPTITSPTTLYVATGPASNDTIEIPLEKYINVTVVDDTAIYDGNPYVTTVSNPSSSDVTGETIIINGETINLQDFGTAAYTNSSENLTGVAAQQVYTLTTNLTTHNITAIEVDSVTYNTPADWTVVGQDITFTNPTFVGGEAIVVSLLTINPTSYSMNKAQLKDAINSNTLGNVFCQNHVSDATKLAIVKDVAGDINSNLVLSGTGLTQFGLSAGSTPPTTRIDSINTTTMDIDDILAAIDQVNTTGYAFSKTVDNRLEIIKFSNTNWTVNTTLEISGPAQSPLGLPTSTIVGAYSETGITSSINDVIQYINDASIPGVTASAISGRIQISSTNEVLDLGNREFNSQATLPTGVYYADIGFVDNEFVTSQWGGSPVNVDDAARFSVWLANDAGLEKTSTNGVTSKFFGWNVLQPQVFRMWATIDAANETDDGNDAALTLYTDDDQIRNIDSMRVGDYVLVLNSNTQPNIDGIHRVTRVSATDKATFYIDKFIETSGNCQSVMVLRSLRFNTFTGLQSTLSMPSFYNWQVGDKAWVTENNTTNKVYEYNGSTFELVFENSDRIDSDQIESVLIYNGDIQEIGIELELFDPIKGYVPGVADREINKKSTVDLATYNMSNDADYVTTQRGAWGDDEVGKTWWDTSKVRYYDYEQGDIDYKVDMWGEQFPGSSIDIYEWTKSSVPPDEWENVVKSQSEQYGVEASGVAYSVFNAASDEYYYYYSLIQEWNEKYARYDDVYYFWVKDKTTVSGNNRKLSTSQMASIISNPTANGISWFAPIGSSQLILANIKNSVNDINSILQISFKSSKPSHQSWITLTEGSDLIPDYWYIGLNDNLQGTQRVTGYPLPDLDIHRFNRYGDNRKITSNGDTFAQGWFKDPWHARREAIKVINRLLKNENLLDDLSGKWHRNITKTLYFFNDDTVYGTSIDDVGIIDWPYIGATFYNTDTDTFYTCTSFDESTNNAEWNINPGFQMVNTWNWTSYISKQRSDDAQPSIEITSPASLDSIDPANHRVVLLRVPYDSTGLERDEIYEYLFGNWVLVEKKNATVEFNDLVHNKNNVYSWDIFTWEGVWDFDPGFMMGYILKACREDLFIERYIDNFNELFFAMIKYTASLHNQIDWFYKTTYVRLDIESRLSSDVKKYTKSHVSEIEGFVNSVKPFHTKIRTIFDKHTATEEVSLTIEELNSGNKSIDIKFDLLDGVYQTKGTTYLGGIFTEEPDEGLFNENDHLFTVEPDDTFIEDVTALEMNFGEAFDAAYNWNDTLGIERRNLVELVLTENLAINVVTNVSGSTDDNDTRTYVYIKNNLASTASYSLTESNATTIVGDVTQDDDVIVLSNGAAFNALGGYAYINGEVIQYMQNDSGTLYGVKRGIGNTLARSHVGGTQIIDITDMQISSNAAFQSDWFYDDGYYKTYPGYDVFSEESILSNNAVNLESIRLKNTSKGVLV